MSILAPQHDPLFGPTEGDVALFVNPVRSDYPPDVLEDGADLFPDFFAKPGRWRCRRRLRDARARPESEERNDHDERSTPGEGEYGPGHEQ